jgi:malate synthase
MAAADSLEKLKAQGIFIRGIFPPRLSPDGIKKKKKSKVFTFRSGEMKPEYASIFTPDALLFLADLHRRFEKVRQKLIKARHDRQKRLDKGDDLSLEPISSMLNLRLFIRRFINLLLLYSIDFRIECIVHYAVLCRALSVFDRTPYLSTPLGELPDFLPSTKDIREGSWKCAPIPQDLLDRRVEITGILRCVIDRFACPAERMHGFLNGRTKPKDLGS